MTTARRPGHPLRRTAGTLAAIALLAAGCTANTPEQPPTDPPPPSASPTESKRDQEARERIEAATAALDALNKETDRLWAEGGTDKLTPALKRYATGELLKDAREEFAMAKQSGLRTEGNPTRLLTDAQGVGNPERADLVQCVDRSAVKIIDKDGKPYDDGVEQTKLMQSYQVELVDDQWKVAKVGTVLLDAWDKSPCDGSWEKDA